MYETKLNNKFTCKHIFDTFTHINGIAHSLATENQAFVLPGLLRLLAALAGGAARQLAKLSCQLTFPFPLKYFVLLFI